MRRRIRIKGKIILFSIVQKRSGFTLIELVIAMVLLLILALIAFNVYTQYITKAKITVAENVLSHARDNLNLYNMDNGKYPNSINFTNCVDENSRPVFPQTFCNQLGDDLEPNSANYTYTPGDNKYILTARARDSKHTLITLTPSRITK